MRIKYQSNDGTLFDTEAECLAHEAAKARDKGAADMERRRREDFDFMVVCAAKGNMSMYELLRDRGV